MSELADLIQELLFARDEIARRAWGNAEGYAAARARQEAARQQILEKVRGLVEIARRLSNEATATPHPMYGGEPQPDFTIDPETLAELDTALAPFKEVTDA